MYFMKGEVSMYRKSINTIMDLFQIVETMKNYIDSRIGFDEDGWPIFEPEHFLTIWPKNMITYQNRNNSRISDKKNTVLCFYTSDNQIYRRFRKIEEDIPIYREFAGIVFPDITVTRDMDVELQNAIILANHMFAAVLAVEGIKLVFNTRCGVKDTQKSFRNIPRNVMCSSGFLGCVNSSDELSASSYTNKILSLLPKKLLIYGKQDKYVDEQLDELGIDYKYYLDFHSVCKKEIV